MEHVSSVHPTGKFPEKVENLKRWARFPGWNFRTECRVPFTFLLVCTSSRSTVGHRDVPAFKTKWNNFLPIGNSTFAPTEISGFFPKWKAPLVCEQASRGAVWRQGGNKKESSQLRLWNLNACIEKVYAKCYWLVEMTLVMASLPLACVF